MMYLHAEHCPARCSRPAVAPNHLANNESESQTVSVRQRRVDASDKATQEVGDALVVLLEPSQQGVSEADTRESIRWISMNMFFCAVAPLQELVEGNIRLNQAESRVRDAAD